MGEVGKEGAVRAPESPWRFLARCYLDLQHLRMACEARLRRLGEGTPEPVRRILEGYHRALRVEERRFLREVSEELEGHPLWAWCERVKGLGPVSALMFLGFVDPYRAETAGKAKAYAGLVPGKKLKSGVRGGFNPEFKGRGNQRV